MAKFFNRVPTHTYTWVQADCQHVRDEDFRSCVCVRRSRLLRFRRLLRPRRHCGAASNVPTVEAAPRRHCGAASFSQQPSSLLLSPIHFAD